MKKKQKKESNIKSYALSTQCKAEHILGDGEDINVSFIKSPKEINDECKMGAAIGMISRKFNPLSENYKTITEEETINFNERWIKKEKHGSLGNHMNFQIDFNNVSIEGAKEIEESRVGVGYTEASTRYILADSTKRKFYTPSYLNDFRMECVHGMYDDIINFLYDRYFYIYEKLSSMTPPDHPGYTKNEKLDSARYALPTAMRTRLGNTVNVNSLEKLFLRLSKSQLHESKEIVTKLEELIKNSEIDHLINLEDIKKTVEKYNIIKKFKNNDCTNAELNYFISEYIYRTKPHKVELKRYSLRPYHEHDVDTVISNHFYGGILNDYEKNIIKSELFTKSYELFDLINDRRLEVVPISIYGTVDYGAFRDIQRHRIGNTFFHNNLNLGLVHNDNIRDIEKIQNQNMLHIDFSQKSFVYYLSKIEVELESVDQSFEKFYNELFTRKQNMIAEYINVLKRHKDDKSFNPELKNVFNVINELWSLTNPLSAGKEFILNTNLREVLYMVKQRTNPDSHISYKTFFEKLMSNIYFLLD